MRGRSRTRAGFRLGLTVVVLVVLAGCALWLADRQARRAELMPPVSSGGVVTAPAPPAAQVQPEPDASPAQRLADAIHSDSAPTTEADPPEVPDGVSWGHAKGLHQTPDELHLKASAAIVMDAASGEVLFRKNEATVLPIASLSKLMTALVITEAKLPMNEVLTITDDDVDRERHSRSRLRVGTSLTRGEALHLALMSSENRAAHALGRTYPGGSEAFAAAMNAKARALGMTHTHYVEPTGLSNRNQSTAHDLAVLTAAAARQPLIRAYSTDPTHEAELGRRLVRFNNSDRLVKNPRWDIHVQKTGYIVEAGQCLIVNATMAGRNLILVLLDSADKVSRIADAERIRHWATGEPYPAPRQSFIKKHLRNINVHLRHKHEKA
jgi:serine-type D-Ala-D-Ala endopeptidase (penicillin-binding protein 7)